MKVKINSFHAVAVWKWNLAPPSALQAAKDAALLYEPSDDEDDDNDDDARLQEQEGAEQDDEDEDVCGICRVAFDGCCPDCKVPGDACPLGAFRSTRRKDVADHELWVQCGASARTSFTCIA